MDSNGNQRSDLLSNDVVQEIKRRRSEYGNAGIAVVAVAGENSHTGRQHWSQQIVTDGKATGSGRPYRDDTIFDMASCSKAFASLAVGILIDREVVVPATGEKLGWNTKVKDILGYRWQLQDNVATDCATLLDLTGMRVGSPIHSLGFREENPEEATFRRRYQRQSVGFRERFQYSRDPTTLALVVEVLMKQSYPDFLDENVFEPLHLESTSQGSAKFKDAGRLAEGFIRTGRDRSKPGPAAWGTARPIADTLATDWLQGDGGLSTDMRDAAKILREFLYPVITPKNIVTERRAPPSHLAVRDLGAAYFFGPGCQFAGYGFGSFQMVYRGFECLFYPGLGFGQTTVAAILPDAGIGCWVTSNDEGPGSMINMEVLVLVFDDLLGLQPVPQPVPRSAPVQPLPVPVPATIKTAPGQTPRGPLTSIGDSILLDPKGFFDPGYGLWRFVELDMLEESSEIVKAIQEGANAHHCHTDFGAIIKPSRNHKVFMADLNQVFVTKIMLLPTETPFIYKWLTVKLWPFTDGSEGYGTRVFGPGRLVVTDNGIGVFDKFISSMGYCKRGVPEEWSNGVHWQVVQTEAEVWLDRVSKKTEI